MQRWAERVILVLLFGLGIGLRFWHLDAVPAAFYHDEMDHVFTGEAVARFGTDISGTWSPWQLRPLHTLNYTAEWPALFHAIVQRLVGYGPSTARLTNALFGLLTVIATGLLAAVLGKNSRVGWWTAALMSINPWHIHLSRMGYEATISLFFQVVLVFSLLKLQAKRRLIWLTAAVPSLVCAYYTYHGAKFTVTVILLGFIGWNLWRTKQLKISSVLLVAVLGLMLFQSLHVQQVGDFGSRQQTDVFSLEQATQLADTERRDRIPLPIDKLVTNKVTTGGIELLRRYFFTFDPYRLWVTGVEGGYQFSLVVTGYFMLSTLLGLILFVKYRHPQQVLLGWLLVISPVATVLTGYQTAMRSAFTYTLLIIMAGWGIWSLIQKWPKLMYLIGALLFFEAGWFGLQYFFRYPLLTANNHYLHERLVARYLAPIQTPVRVVMERDAYSMARAIVFYTQRMTTLSPRERAQFAAAGSPTYTLGNVTVTTDCPTVVDPQTTLIIDPSKWTTCMLDLLVSPKERQAERMIALPSPLDNGDYFWVWHDKTCADKPVTSFVHLTNLDSLSVERLSDTNFCRMWAKGR